MILTFLFWNFNLSKGDTPAGVFPKLSGEKIVSRLVHAHGVDVVVLAECELRHPEILKELQRGDERFETPRLPHSRFQFFTRFSSDQFEVMEPKDRRISIHRLRLHGFQDILVSVIHHVDSRNHSPGAQLNKFQLPRLHLLQAEREAGHSRTILFGDFNMNPYHPAMLNPELGLGAMMTRALAATHSLSDTHGRFYNPMWKMMGHSHVPGTFYWRNPGEPSNPYWNCFDGVLIRPSLLDAFHDEDLQILRELPNPTGAPIGLVRKTGRHWRLNYSDHLPLLFKIRLTPDPDLQEVGDV